MRVKILSYYILCIISLHNPDICIGRLIIYIQSFQNRFYFPGDAVIPGDLKQTDIMNISSDKSL